MEVAALTAFLAPFLPRLMNAAGRIAGDAVDEAGKEVDGLVHRLWDKLRGRVEQNDSAREAAKDVAQNPDDEDFRTVLRVQLGKLLTEDPELAAEVTQLWDEGVAKGLIVTNVTASGAGAVAIGRDAVGTHINTGPSRPPG
jgi:hypothetical protein